MTENINSLTPWWAKMAIKVCLGFLPISYEHIRAYVTGFHGSMENASYAESIFDKYINDWARFKAGIVPGGMLELGPGGSLLTGLMALKFGFKPVYLVDVGNFIARSQKLYYDMGIFCLEAEDRETFLTALDKSGDVITSLNQIGVVYMTEGLNSIKKIPSQSVSFSFSNAVLEHVRLDEFSETVSEIYRIHQVNTISSHQVDYRDHLDSSLNNLRFPKSIWESRLFPNAGFYTNRLRNNDVKRTFVEVGFSIELEETTSWTKLPLPQNIMSGEFKNYDESELLINVAHLVFKKHICSGNDLNYI